MAPQASSGPAVGLREGWSVDRAEMGVESTLGSPPALQPVKMLTVAVKTPRLELLNIYTVKRKRNPNKEGPSPTLRQATRPAPAARKSALSEPHRLSEASSLLSRKRSLRRRRLRAYCVQAACSEVN